MTEDVELMHMLNGVFMTSGVFSDEVYSMAVSRLIGLS